MTCRICSSDPAAVCDFCHNVIRANVEETSADETRESIDAWLRRCAEKKWESLRDDEAAMLEDLADAIERGDDLP